MVIPTNAEIYNVSCSNCSWEVNETVSGINITNNIKIDQKLALISEKLGLTKSGKDKLINKYTTCPKCGSDVIVKKQLVRW